MCNKTRTLYCCRQCGRFVHSIENVTLCEEVKAKQGKEGECKEGVKLLPAVCKRDAICNDEQCMVDDLVGK